MKFPAVCRRCWRAAVNLLSPKDTVRGETVESLALALDARDPTTHQHALRVKTYAVGLGRHLQLPPTTLRLLEASALLHDIGKVAVPDHILNKPGKLTEDEFNIVKRHTVVGAQIAGRLRLNQVVGDAIRHHHEQWDGRGYPDGLNSHQIPKLARIISVVDAFDAMLEARPYKAARTRAEAILAMYQGKGTQFDPDLVERFIYILPSLEAEVAKIPLESSTFSEQLTQAARAVAPAAGLANN